MSFDNIARGRPFEPIAAAPWVDELKRAGFRVILGKDRFGFVRPGHHGPDRYAWATEAEAWEAARAWRTQYPNEGARSA